MKKKAINFKTGDLFKRFGTWNFVEDIIIDEIKVTFVYNIDGIKNWATFMHETLIPFK